MSTGLECLFFKITETGEWFYALEDWKTPKGAFDWRVYATGYGPFETEVAARQHLHDHHPNPGGSMMDEAASLSDLVLTGLVTQARADRAQQRQALASAQQIALYAGSSRYRGGGYGI